MLVEVIVDNLPYDGKRGTVKDIPANEAKVHMMLGTAKPAVKPDEKKPEPKRERTDRRKDVKPAGTVVVEPEASTEGIEPSEVFTAEAVSSLLLGESSE